MYKRQVDDLADDLKDPADAMQKLRKDSESTFEHMMRLPVKEVANNFSMQLKPAIQETSAQMVNFTALAIQAGQTMQNAFTSSLIAAFSELEEGETRFGKFKESLTGMLRDMIIQFAAAAIAAFALAVAIRFAIGGAAGIGGISDIFGTMQSVGGFMPNIPMLAEGGVVTAQHSP